MTKNRPNDVDTRILHEQCLGSVEHFLHDTTSSFNATVFCISIGLLCLLITMSQNTNALSCPYFKTYVICLLA